MSPETQSETPVGQRKASNGLDPTRDRLERWHSRVLGFCLVIFALQIGIFLTAFPWTLWWEMNWIPVHSPKMSDFWMNRFFRGAVSGLGLLNVYVAFGELFKQLKSIFFSAQK